MHNRNYLPGLLGLSMAFLLGATACKKPAELPGNPGTGGSSVRPVGQPVTDAWFEVLGPGGGVVKSEDGRVEIDIPAGALTEDTEIGIQPLKNTAVSGIGFSYRLTPHGKAFQKKVTIRFSYKNDVGRLSSTLALEIAYQNEKGIWTCAGNTVNDPVQKTISVETDHFSDWDFIASMQLTPVVKTIGLAESVRLKAFRYVYPTEGNDFLVPLTYPGAGSGEPQALEQRFIVKWTLDGPGRLEVNGNEASYIAPAAMPSQKTAVVSLELNVGGKKVLLISTIEIIEEGISLSINGGDWHTYSGSATKTVGLGKYSLANLRLTTDLPQIVFMWPLSGSARADGIYSWNMLGQEDSHVAFEYATPSLATIYAAEYEDANHNVRNSGGFLQVEEVEKDGKKFLAGMFAIDQAGVIESATGEQTGVSNIVGTFRVPRYW